MATLKLLYLILVPARESWIDCEQFVFSQSSRDLASEQARRGTGERRSFPISSPICLICSLPICRKKNKICDCVVLVNIFEIVKVKII